MDMQIPPLVQTLLTLLLTGFAAVLWYLLTGTKQDAKDAKEAAVAAQKAASDAKADADRKVAELRVHVAETYVTQEGLTKAISSLDQTINRLIETVTQYGKDTREALSELHRRIDGKADK